MMIALKNHTIHLDTNLSRLLSVPISVIVIEFVVFGTYLFLAWLFSLFGQAYKWEDAFYIRSDLINVM